MSRSPTPSDDVDRFLNEADRWQTEMAMLRDIALACGLEEHIKWGLPCYTFEGSNVAIIQPFKETCALMFFKGVLLDDPENLLDRPGKNSHAARRMDFSDEGQVAAMDETLRAFIAQAIDVEKRGVEVPPREEREAVPEELEQAFDEVPGLEDAFSDLTPGRQRGYILHFSSAKQASTRRSRIEKCVPKIMDSKGLRE